MQFNQPDTLIPDLYNILDWNRYAYARGNPLKYTDPDGHRPCDLVCEGDIIDWNEAKKGSAWYGEWDIKKQKENEEKAEAILDGITTLGLGSVVPPLGLFYQAISDEPITGWDLAFAALPGGGAADDIGRGIGKYADDILKLTEGHHLIPRQILKKLPSDLRIAVQGKRGAPNIWQIPRNIHRAIHSGPGPGGAYNAVWREAIYPLLDRGNVTPQEILAIRDQIVGAFGLLNWKP